MNETRKTARLVLMASTLLATTLALGADTTECDQEYQRCYDECQRLSPELGSCVINCQRDRRACYDDLQR